MKMGTHTPGPWCVEGSEGARCMEVTTPKGKRGYNRLIAQVFETSVMRTEEDRQGADARLIAAAPDLLAALKAARDAIASEFAAMGEDWKDQPVMRDKSKLLDKIDALIAKTQRT